MNKESPTPQETYDVAVIGGGPAGMMAAGRAAERGLRVILVEKNESLGKKLLITGGGRCNVTNNQPDVRAFLSKFKDAEQFLFSTFSQHDVTHSLSFFNTRGMETKVEAENRVFPTSNKAQSVWDVLIAYIKEGNVTVRSNAPVCGLVQESPGIISGVKIKKTGSKEIEIIRAKNVILATGGRSHPETGSTGEGFEWLQKAGHTVSEPHAALVPIEVSDEWVKKLSGVSLPKAKVTLFLDGIKQTPLKKRTNLGKILFTHFGLSGPLILNLSSEIGELLTYGEVILSLDIMPTHDYATLNEALQNLFKKESNKKFKNAIDALIPAAFIPVILEKSDIDGETPCHSITREERLALVTLLKDIHIHPTKLLGTDKAIITSGGVALTEIDFKTMRSRLISNLYIVGDVLNIDRPSGGYSLQLCWSTGWVAGNSIPLA
ncbi:MAG: aminoacetone oxidase family FAD-binding enzyme [Candidatus Taylorbacteria bacterium]